MTFAKLHFSTLDGLITSSDLFASLFHSFVTSRIVTAYFIIYHCWQLKSYNTSWIQQLSPSWLVATARAPLMLCVTCTGFRLRLGLGLRSLKIVHGTAPQYLRDKVKIKTNTRFTRSSNRVQLHCPSMPRPRLKSMGERCFYSSCAAVWSSLPLESQSCSKFDTFKSRLQTYLYQQSYVWSF